MIMLKRNSKSSNNIYSHEIIAIQHLILEFIQKNHWDDYDGFSRSLSESILKYKPKNEDQLKKIIKSYRHPFFTFNKNSRQDLIDRFPYQKIIERIKNIPLTEKTKTTINISSKIIVKPKKNNIALSFSDIFPEIKEIDSQFADTLLTKLDIPERDIQNVIRDALRQKGATNITRRESDTSLEIADIEDFSLRIRDESKSFVVIVKGYRSVRKKKINFEAIGHQIFKAYQSSQPDYVIIVIAKDLVDGVITQLKQYAQNVGKPNLIILCDPLDLARLLYWKKIIN